MYMIAVILMIVAMAVTVGVLVAGLFTMGNKPSEDVAAKSARSNILMRARIMAQFLALMFFALAAYLFRLAD
jgi:flagellar basal body-associated protein FliL